MRTLRKLYRGFRQPALLMAAASLFGLAMAASGLGYPFIAACIGVVGFVACDALADYRAEQARATQALYFITLLTQGSDTTITLEHVTRKETSNDAA